MSRSRRMADLPSGAVTFLFTDIEGSTPLVKLLRDRYADVLAEHQRLLRSAFANHRPFRNARAGSCCSPHIPLGHRADLATETKTAHGHEQVVGASAARQQSFSCASRGDVASSILSDLSISASDRSACRRGNKEVLRYKTITGARAFPADEFPGRRRSNFMIPVASDPTMGSARAEALESDGREMRCLNTRLEPARNGRRPGTSSRSSRPSRRSETRRSRASVS